MADLPASAVTRLAARINEAMATLELDLERTVQTSEAAVAEAKEARLALFEARAHVFRRSALYRLGRATTVDTGLVEGLVALDDASALGVDCLNEAAVAWRAGDRAEGRRLATLAVAGYRRAHHGDGELLARCLAAACGEPLEEAEVLRLASQALVSDVPTIGAQALGLLACGPGLPDWRVLAERSGRRAAAEAPAAARLDVTSLEEALGPFSSHGPGPGPLNREG